MKYFLIQNINDLHLCKDFKETIWVLLAWIFSLIGVLSIELPATNEITGAQSAILIFAISVLSAVYPKMAQCKKIIPKIIYFLLFIFFLSVFSICIASLLGMKVCPELWKLVHKVCISYVIFIVIDLFLIFFFPPIIISEESKLSDVDVEYERRKKLFLEALYTKEE